MQIKEKIWIQAAPEAVWPWVESPLKRQQWNPKLKNVADYDHASPAIGTRYRMDYVLNGKVRTCHGEVIEFSPPHQLCVRVTPHDASHQFNAVEEYRLHSNGGGTIFQQNVTVADHRLNVFWRALIWIILRYGKPVGESHLARLKQLVEGAPGA